jgi:DNA-binding MarR family transcriptional regulator
MTQERSVYDALMIGALLAIPAQVISRRVTVALYERGFTDYRSTYHPIFQWCKPEGSRLTELAERVGVAKQSMAGLIDVLEQRGYVERVPDPTDGRATLIRRTERGWEVNRVARQVVEEIQREWTEALGQERFTALLDALRQLAAVLDEPIGAAGHREERMPPKKKHRSWARTHDEQNDGSSTAQR